MAETVMGNIYTDILTPYLDENNMIPFEKAEALLLDSKVELKGYEEQIPELFKELDDFFEYIADENGDKVKCLNVKKEVVAAEKSVEEPKLEEQKPEMAKKEPILDEKAVKATNAKLINALRKMEREYADSKGFIAMTNLGQKRAEMGIELPLKEKLSAYLMRFPELFEISGTGTDTMVRLAVKGIAGTPIVTKAATKSAAAVNVKTVPTTATVAPVPASKRFVSFFHLFDFAYFPNYAEIKAELANIAKQDGWFVLTDENEKDPYFLVDMKLRSNFAMAVQKQLQGEDAGIRIALDSASFDTGFVTPEGAAIRAEFKLNQYREASSWQSWVFNEFTVVSK
ncbi:MAG: hypothetical protein IKW32_08395 [Bacteroidaceae bacterium]|nr:hypothetical protein [Bacteroidaceae bacterium]